LELSATIRRVGASQVYPVMPIPHIPAGFLTENEWYELLASIDGEPLPGDCQITFNDLPAMRFMQGAKSVFRVHIDFYAGDVRVAVLRGPRVLGSVHVVIDPDVAKLTREEYASMVAAIARATSTLYKLGAVTLPTTTSAHARRADIVTLDLIRANFAAFEGALNHIADQPMRSLSSSTVRVDLFRAKNVTDRSIALALRARDCRPAAPEEVRAAPALVGALGGRWVPSVLETRRTDRLNTYENRALVGFMRWLDGTILSLMRRLKAKPDWFDDPISVVWANRLGRCRNKLAALSRRPPFFGLSPERSLHATSVFLMHPHYSRAFSAMSRMRAGVASGAHLAPNVPIDRTYNLYETWCYIELLLAVTRLFPESKAAVSRLLESRSSPQALGTFLAKGTAAQIPLTTDMSLTYHRRFVREPDAEGCRTALIDAVPDISISRTNAKRESVGLVVIDPKYRTGASLRDGIRDLHVYRDAIIDARGSRIVRGAAALAPRQQKDFPQFADSLPATDPVVVSARPTIRDDVFDRLLRAAIASLR
jgi:PD-(D/E)XK nuclease superfamily/Domain of unknown function (DUF2357)